MDTYEKLVKLEKNYRRGIRPDMAIFGFMPMLGITVVICHCIMSDDFTDNLKFALSIGFLSLVFIALGAAVVLFGEKGKSPKTVEADFEMMREQMGIPDQATFCETLDRMGNYEKFIFIDHRYLLDFRSLSVIPIKSILKVDKGSVYNRRNSSHFVWVFADDQLKIRCSRKRGQEALFNALNLAVMEKNTMLKKGSSLQTQRWAACQGSGDAEMDEIKIDQDISL